MTNVSVILPVYNCELFVAETIESVLNQTFEDYEFIIINDGSTDNSLAIINKYALIDSRIKVISHSNKGLGTSLNIGIKQSIGDIIVRIDQDDLMLPNRIEKQYNYLLQNAEIDVLSCLADYINERGEIIGKTFSDLKNISVCNKYLTENEPIGILHPGVVMKKESINKVGGYRGKFFPCEDIDLWNRLVENGYVIVVMQEILMQYRISSVSEITVRFINSRIKFEWVRETMWCRRSGMCEPTWDEYLIKRNNRSWLQKLNWKRKTYAKHYYRAAGFDFAQKKYGAFIFHLMSAGLLQPMYALRKITKQRV